MTPDQLGAIKGEVESSHSRMAELLEALAARRGESFAFAANYVANVTVALAVHENLIKNFSPKIASISELALDLIGPEALEIGALLAFSPANLTRADPSFKSCLRDFATELQPLLSERQRIQNRAQSIMKESP